MGSATDFFVELYNGSIHAVLVLDPQQNCIYKTPAMEELLSVLYVDEKALLTAGVLRQAKSCQTDLHSDVLPAMVGNCMLELSLLPYPYEGSTYLLLQAHRKETPLEQQELLTLLRNAQGKMSGYLNEIYGTVQGKDGDLHQEIAGSVRRILRLTSRLYELLDGAGKLRTRAPMNLADFLNKYIRTYNEIDSRIRVTLNCAHTWLCAKVMPEDMEMALSALISNALRFGGPQIQVVATQTDDTVKISVLDSGAGVQEPERLYQIGYRTPDPRGVVGLGMSLAMAKKVLELQGATLQYIRSNGVTEFCITFKAYEMEEGEQLASWSEEDAKESLSLLRIEMSDIIKEMDLL